MDNKHRQFNGRRPRSLDSMVLFPVLISHRNRHQSTSPKDVPFCWIEQFREQIERNHGQTLEGLSRRGGLGPEEIQCAAEGKNISAITSGLITEKSASEWLKIRMSEWEQNVTCEPRGD